MREHNRLSADYYSILECLQLAKDSRTLEQVFDKGYEYVEDLRMWPADAPRVDEKLEKLQLFKELVLKDAKAAGPGGMAELSGIAQLLSERLESLKMSLVLNDLSDDEKTKAISSYKLSFEKEWTRRFAQYRRLPEDASNLREWFWE